MLRFSPRRPAAAGLFAAALAVGGCVSAPPDLDPARLAADAVRLHGAAALVLRDSPDPLDVGSDKRVPLDVDVEGVTDAAPLTATAAALRAVLNDAGLQAALADTRAALADARQARLIANPVLDLGVRFPDGGGGDIVEAGLTQPITDLLRRPARSRAADGRLRAAAQHAVTSALDSVHAARVAYARVQAADDRLAVLDEQAALLDRLVELAVASLAGGESSQRDLTGFRAQRAALDADVIRGRADRHAARLHLLRLMGRPTADPEFAIAAPPLSPPPTPGPSLGAPPDTEHSARAAWEAALTRRPEIRAAVYELEALSEDVELARLSAWGDFSLGASYEDDGDTSLGPAVGGPLPIFDRGRQRQSAARAGVLAAQHRLTDAGRRVVQEVRTAWGALAAADEELAALDQRLVPLQEERLEQTRAAYRAGFADVTDVLQAQGDLLDARARRVDARLNRRTAAADLARATGGAPLTAD